MFKIISKLMIMKTITLAILIIVLDIASFHYAHSDQSPNFYIIAISVCSLRPVTTIAIKKPAFFKW